MTTFIHLKLRSLALFGSGFLLVAFMLGFSASTAIAQPNDLCTGAISITCGSMTTGSTSGAGDDTAPFCATGDGPGGGVWYSFSGTGGLITVSLCGAGTDYDSKIRVFTGTCGTLVCEAGNDDFCSLKSSVSISTVLGTTYLLLVHGFGPDEGNFDLSVTCEATCSINSSLTKTDATSSGASDGSIMVSASCIGTCGTLQYSLNGGTPQSSPSFIGLAPGNYTVTTSNVGTVSCSDTETIFVGPVATSGFCDAAGYITGQPIITPSGNACVDAICAADPFCCDVEWDGICASEAATEPDCNFCRESPYVLVATGKDLEFDESIAHGGGIGVVDPNGEAEVEDNAMVVAPGTFVKAPKIDIDNSSSVANPIFMPADPVLPVFRCNDTSPPHDDNIRVEEGETVILTESIYEDIEVKDDATLIFSGQKDVYIEDFEIEDNTTIIFDQCTNVMVFGEMDMGKDTRFNTVYPMDVAVFVKGDITVRRRSHVNAILYSQDLLTIKAASASSPTIMRGLFIGEEVRAKEFGLYYAHSYNPTCPMPLQAPEDEVVEQMPAQQLDQVPETELVEETETSSYEDTKVIPFEQEKARTNFRLYPNPATDQIYLSLQGQMDKEAVIRIYNTQGQLMLEKNYLTLDEGNIAFDLNVFATGMYNMIISIEGETPVAKKFVITR